METGRPTASDQGFATTELVGPPERLRHSGLFERLDLFRFAGPGPGRALVRRFDLGRVSVALIQSTGHDIAIEETGRVTFLAPLDGAVAVSAGTARLRAGVGGAVLVQPGHRHTAVRPDASGRFQAAVALAPALHPARGRPSGRAGTGEDGPMRALGGYLTYLLHEIARPGSPVLRPAGLRAAEAAILDLFAAMDLRDAPPVRVALPPESRVRQAEDFMRARSDEPLTIAEIALHVGIGPRALQLAFAAHRGASPRAVLAGFRLERARSRLLADNGTGGVTDVALLSGFCHLGRFAAAYQARFGEHPSVTLRHARA